jgi:hypothetical protein
MKSTYDFGPVKGVMVANITQAGDRIQCTFDCVQEPSGKKYNGPIYGTAKGDKVDAYYLSAIDHE